MNNAILFFAQTSGGSSFKQGLAIGLGLIAMVGFLYGVLLIYSGAEKLKNNDPSGKGSVIAGIWIAGAIGIMGVLYAAFGLSSFVITPSAF